MKTFRVAVLFTVLVGLIQSASAALYTFSFTNGFANSGVVPDGNATGWFDTRDLSGIGDALITDVDVSLQISGGFNGDVYAYLTHSSGFSVLLNRVGRTAGNSFGYGNSGLNLTLDDNAASGDVHGYQSVAGFLSMIGNGSRWLPDGRNVNPLFTVDTDSRTQLLNQFNNLDPNGAWTLFVADLSNGEQGTVVSWGLNITAVPEPSMACLCALGVATLICSRRTHRSAGLRPGVTVAQIANLPYRRLAACPGRLPVGGTAGCQPALRRVASRRAGGRRSETPRV